MRLRQNSTPKALYIDEIEADLKLLGIEGSLKPNEPVESRARPHA